MKPSKISCVVAHVLLSKVTWISLAAIFYMEFVFEALTMTAEEWKNPQWYQAILISVCGFGTVCGIFFGVTWMFCEASDWAKRTKRECDCAAEEKK